MKFSISACLIFSALVPSAYALTGADLDAANAYFTLHPEIQKSVPDVYNLVMSANTLEQANDFLSNNKPWNPVTNDYWTFDPIPRSTIQSVPMVNLTPAIAPPVHVSDTDSHSYMDNQIAPLKTTLDQDNQQIAQNVAGITQNHNDIAENHHDIVKTQGEVAENQDAIHRTREVVTENSEHIAQNNDAIHRTREVVTANSKAIIQDEHDIEKNQEGLKQTHEQIQRTREVVAVNSGHIADNSHEIDRNHKGIEQNQDAIVKNSDTIKQDEKFIGNNQKAITENRRDIDANGNNINTVHSEVRATQAQTESNTGQINKLNSNFSNLKSEVNENKKEASAGISGAMAQANIPQVIQGQTFAIGAGVGGYEGENAVAVGMSARVSQSVIVKATMSDDTQQNVGYGAGVSIGW